MAWDVMRKYFYIDLTVKKDSGSPYCFIKIKLQEDKMV